MSNSISTYDILNDIRNGKTPVKRQNPQPGESPYYYIQSNGDKSYLPITEKNIIDVNSADEPNPLWCSAFQKTTNTGSNEVTQTSVADSVLSGTFDTPQTNSLGINSTQTDNLGFNSVSSTNNTTSLFDTTQTTPFSTSQTTSFGSASSETTPMTPFEATQTTPLGSSTLGTFSSDSSSYGINPTSSTVPFNTNNSSFSETLNQYFSPNMPTEQSYLSTAQTQNTSVSPVNMQSNIADVSRFEPSTMQKVFNSTPVREGMLFVQGVANSPLNVAKYPAQWMGMDTRPIKPQTAHERGIEAMGSEAYTAATTTVLGNGFAAAGGFGKTIQAAEMAKRSGDIVKANQLYKQAHFIPKNVSHIFTGNPVNQAISGGSLNYALEYVPWMKTDSAVTDFIEGESFKKAGKILARKGYMYVKPFLHKFY
ncbi:MAG: hypothetical protein IJO11_05375 [Alphaproteobacteria bacterium]|nr:hypothetical protein [Alphaproteobacteria bacterium]